MRLLHTYINGFLNGTPKPRKRGKLLLMDKRLKPHKKFFLQEAGIGVEPNVFSLWD